MKFLAIKGTMIAMNETMEIGYVDTMVNGLLTRVPAISIARVGEGNGGEYVSALIDGGVTWIRAQSVPAVGVLRRRAMLLADEAGRLREERDDALKRVGELTMKLERLERQVKK